MAKTISAQEMGAGLLIVYNTEGANLVMGNLGNDTDVASIPSISLSYYEKDFAISIKQIR
jgi:hypothetical protein